MNCLTFNGEHKFDVRSYLGDLVDLKTELLGSNDLFVYWVMGNKNLTSKLNNLVSALCFDDDDDRL